MWPVFSTERPTEAEVKAELDNETDPSYPIKWYRADIYVDINGPYSFPEALERAATNVVDNADNTGCSDDLTVTSHSAVEALRKCLQNDFEVKQ
jgi:hypothetical protein